MNGQIRTELATKPTVGFVGLGKMGMPMAKNLLKKGFPLVVHDVSEAACGQMASLGAQLASGAGDLASRVGMVITMLPSGREVQLVALGKGGLKEGLARGSVHIDMSTVEPETTRLLAAEMAEIGVLTLDAPVSRGQQAAIDGTLSIMVGGDQAVYERCRPVLAAVGTDIFHCGDTGMGSVFKLVNNLIVATTVCAVSEALVMGVKAGANLRALVAVLNASSGNSFVLERFVQKKALMGDFKPGGSIDTVAKDMELALGLAGEHRIGLPLGAVAYQMYCLLRGQGDGGQDFTSVIKVAEAAAGIQARMEHSR